MKTTLRAVSLVGLAAAASLSGGCLYAYHAPGEGTQVAVGPPPVIVAEPAPVVYGPPVYYGPPPVSFGFNFGSRGHWGHGGHYGHWHH